MVQRLIAVAVIIVVAVGVWLQRPFLVLAGLSSTQHVTLVFGHPVRLDVTTYDFYTKIGTGTTTNRALVAKIVGVINQADVPSPGPVACPALPGRHSTLRFYYRNGDTWTVYFDGCWGLSAHGRFGIARGDPPVYTALPRLLDRVTRRGA